MGERGYSLLEVMISMVVLAIAFLALIATQVGTLGGYVAARDEQHATELMRRTAELLQIQGMQWVADDPIAADPNPPDPTDPANGFEDLYINQPPFDETNPLGAIVDATDWVALVDTPVDVRFQRVSADTANHLGGKFCIFARGGTMSEAFADDTGQPVISSIRVQIAVVYPGPRQQVSECADLATADLNDVGGAGEPPALENAGFRVTYGGTIVSRRAHLTNPALTVGL